MKQVEEPSAVADATFLRHNAMYWSASLGVAFINYLYYPVLGHLLNPVNFGETQTILSVLTQASVFLQVLGLVSVGIITKYRDDAERERVSAEISRVALLLSLIVLPVGLACSGLLKNFFHFTSITPFWLLAAALLVSVPLSLSNAYLQGHKRFGTLSISTIIGAVSKLGLSSVLVVAGFKTLGAVGGLVLAQMLMLAYTLASGQGIGHFVRTNFHVRRLRLHLLKPELPYALLVLITSVTINLMLSFDILVVKHYFSPHQAGLYSGISIISNIVFFLTGPLAIVLIPSLSPVAPHASNRRLLRRSLLLSLVIGGGATAVFIAVPHLIVTILLGHRYAPYAGYLRGLSLALFCMSVANLLIYYAIGLRHYLIAPVVLAGLILTLVLLVSRHVTMGQVVQDLLIGASSLLAAVIALTAYYDRRHQRQELAT